MKKATGILSMAVLLTATTAFAEVNRAKVNERVGAAQTMFREIMDAKDKAIPQDLLERAHCAALIPALKHGGFIVGAQYGKGFLMCRQTGGGWRGPAAIRIEGGSFGLQIGAGETDLVLLVMNKSGAEKMTRSEFKLGGKAEVMAGPVGRSAQADTDAYMRAEMLGYSRARGVFAGIALEGSTIRQDSDDNRALYGTDMSNHDILFGPSVKTPAAGSELAALLTRYSTWEKH